MPKNSPPTPAPRTALGKILGTFFNIPDRCPTKFYVLWRLGKLIGFNRHVPWPVHFTSTVIAPRRMKIGKGTCPGDSPHCYINAQNGIQIGDYCNLAPGVGLISANHDPLDNTKHLPSEPIRLGENCWVGMNAVILPGVTLGPNTIVGAGAVVTKSFVEGHCVIAGNPAKEIRKL